MGQRIGRGVAGRRSNWGSVEGLVLIKARCSPEHWQPSASILFQIFIMAGEPNTQNSEPVVHGSTMGSTAPHIVIEKHKDTDVDYLEAVPTNQSVEYAEAKKQSAIEALGIEDWQAKEKQIVRRLDLTLMPQLWILYSAYSATNRCSEIAEF